MVKIFLSNKVIVTAIVINAIVIFAMSFPELIDNKPLFIIESLFTIFFMFEVIVKSRHFGFRNYAVDNFNKLDIAIVILSIPSLILPLFFGIQVTSLTLLRIVRLLRITRILKYIPNMNHLISGIVRAFKASILVFLSCFLYIFLLSIVSCHLFQNSAPEYFADPLISFYTTFKLFTVEGWNDISDQISQDSSYWVKGFSRFYFMFVVLSGGIFGLSIANAVFVDEMTMDNNILLEEKIDKLNNKIDRLEKTIRNEL